MKGESEDELNGARDDLVSGKRFVGRRYLQRHYGFERMPID